MGGDDQLPAMARALAQEYATASTDTGMRRWGLRSQWERSVSQPGEP
jgi:hypothetical protein